MASVTRRAAPLLALLAGCTGDPAPRLEKPVDGDTAGLDSAPTDSDPTEPTESTPTEPTESGDSTPDSTGETGDSGEPPPPAAGPRGLLVAQDWDHRDLPTGAGAGQYRVIFLQESMYTLLPEIRAANPDALLLAYQKVGGMREDGGDHPSTGVQVGEADESWFLHGEDGERLEYCDYDGVWAADIGNPGYQARWLENVRDRVVADGFDGVMLDDTNTFPGHCLGERGGTPIAEYPTDEAYGDAVVAFMAAVGPGLRADGLAVAPNLAMNPWEATMLAQCEAMLPYMTHWVREYWMRWDDSGNFTGDDWESTLATMEIAQAAGVGYLALTYGPGEEGAVEGQRYGRASWLLTWDGTSDSAWGYWGDGEDPWGPDWGPDLGLPTAPARPVRDAWLRDYTGGVVVVNPSDDAVAIVPLGGTFEDPELGAVDEVRLEPGRGRVLTR